MGNLYHQIRPRKHMMPCPATLCTCPRYAYDRALYLETLRQDRFYVGLLRSTLYIGDRLGRRSWYIRLMKSLGMPRNCGAGG